jgi:alcohol/geraniol dehydrogenase (NADP+)
MNTIKAYATHAPKAPLQPFEYEPARLGDDQVDVAVSYCGICHSDLSMIENEWGMTAYPFVGGHEVVGKVVAIGDHVKNLKIGQTVGVGWYSGSCMSCRQCMSGDHNLCATAEGTIIHRHGGFATQVRAHSAWTIPLPEGIDPTKAGPLFCGGITVFNPIVQFGVKPTDRVGVIGIGGLGHLALKFLRAWGCDVVAFTSSDSKRDEAIQLGANRVVNSRNSAEMEKLAGAFNFILSTVNVKLDWQAYVNALAPRGRLHTVGAIAEPVSLSAFPLLVGQRSFSGSPLGSPATTATMLEFAARHGIAPTAEFFPMSKINDAFEHLKAGKARYRIVLENDLN